MNGLAVWLGIWKDKTGKPGTRRPGVEHVDGPMEMGTKREGHSIPC